MSKRKIYKKDLMHEPKYRELWDQINKFANGGPMSITRMKAVVQIDNLIRDFIEGYDFFEEE